MSGGERYGAIEDAEAIRAIHRALDAGVNCVDTAPAYGFGHAEEVVGQALAGRRHGVILVTKCGLAWDPGNPAIRRDTAPASLKREVDLSLRRLRTDVIDVYLIHWPNAETPFEEAFLAMDEIVRAGKVRFVGVSNFTVEQMEACMRVRRIDVVQVGYHLFDRRMEREVFPVLRAPRHRRHGLRPAGPRPPDRRVHRRHALRRARTGARRASPSASRSSRPRTSPGTSRWSTGSVARSPSRWACR